MEKAAAAYQYVNPSAISPHLECAVCLAAFIDPVTLPCEHVFCEKCARLCASESCPTCRTPVIKSEIQPCREKTLLRMLADIAVYCSQKQAGCPWTGSRGNLIDHESKTCEFSLCPRKGLGCEWKGKRVDFSEHENDCGCVSIACSARDALCTWRGLRKDLETHISNCDFHRLRPILLTLLNRITTLELQVKSIPILPPNLNGIDASGMDFSNRDLSRANLDHAILRRADLSNAILPNRLTGTDFTGAKLTGADFTLTICTSVKFVEASLRNAKLVRAQLKSADFTKADLTEADLRCCTLESANCLDAILVRANLCHVNIRGGDITNADFCDAKLHRAFAFETDGSARNLNVQDCKTFLTQERVFQLSWEQQVKFGLKAPQYDADHSKCSYH